MTVLVYGSLAPDVVFGVPRLPRAGEDVPGHSVTVVAAGGGGNVAVALARWGFDVMAIGNTLGTDPLGRWAADEYHRLGIRTAPGLMDARSTTPANGVIVTPDGERTIIGNDYATVRWMEVPEWAGITTVVVDAYSGEAGEEVIRSAAARRLTVVGSDRTGPGTRDLSILLWSADEHPDPAEAATTAAAGPTVVVTGGPRPISVYHSDGSTFQVTPPRRPAVDSTGAGDVFTAAVTAGVVEALGLAATLDRAAAVAAGYVAAGRASGIPPLATLGP